MTQAPKKINAALSKAIADAPAVSGVIWAHESEIEDSPYQFRPIDLESPENRDMVQSILKHGVLQPGGARLISGKKHKGIKYQLAFAHRRLHCSREAAKTNPERAWFPLIVRDYSDVEMAEIALVENVQREDPSDWVTALGIKKLMEVSAEKGQPLSEGEVAKRISKVTEDGKQSHYTVSYVRNHLGLFKLRPQLQEVAQRRNAVRSSLFEIQKVTDPEIERELIEQIDKPKPVGYQTIKTQVEKHLQEEAHKRESIKPEPHSAKRLQMATARQREARQRSRELLTEMSGHLHALTSYLGDVGDEYFDNEIAPRIERLQSQLKQLKP